MPTDINVNKIDCFYLSSCSKKILHVPIVQLVIAISTDFKKLILTCEGCHKLFEKLFESEKYFNEVKKVFNRNPFKKHSGRKSSNNLVMLINLLDMKKDFCLKGEIIISHCKEHDCIILFFVFNDFYENHRRLLSKNFYSR